MEKDKIIDQFSVVAISSVHYSSYEHLGCGCAVAISSVHYSSYEHLGCGCVVAISSAHCSSCESILGVVVQWPYHQFTIALMSILGMVKGSISILF